MADIDNGFLCNHLHHTLTDESLCVPMMAQGEALGVLYLSFVELGQFTAAKQQLAKTVAENIALALANLDTFGHEAGDTVLREVAQFLQKFVRGSDIACRYSGKEFILILPEASLEVISKRAEQLRESIKHLKLEPCLLRLRCAHAFYRDS